MPFQGTNMCISVGSAAIGTLGAKIYQAVKDTGETSSLVNKILTSGKVFLEELECMSSDRTRFNGISNDELIKELICRTKDRGNTFSEKNVDYLVNIINKIRIDDEEEPKYIAIPTEVLTKRGDVDTKAVILATFLSSSLSSIATTTVDQFVDEGDYSSKFDKQLDSIPNYAKAILSLVTGITAGTGAAFIGREVYDKLFKSLSNNNIAVIKYSNILDKLLQKEAYKCGLDIASKASKDELVTKLIEYRNEEYQAAIKNIQTKCKLQDDEIVKEFLEGIYRIVTEKRLNNPRISAVFDAEPSFFKKYNINKQNYDRIADEVINTIRSGEISSQTKQLGNAFKENFLRKCELEEENAREIIKYLTKIQTNTRDSYEGIYIDEITEDRRNLNNEIDILYTLLNRMNQELELNELDTRQVTELIVGVSRFLEPITLADSKTKDEINNELNQNIEYLKKSFLKKATGSIARVRETVCRRFDDIKSSCTDFGERASSNLCEYFSKPNDKQMLLTGHKSSSSSTQKGVFSIFNKGGRKTRKNKNKNKHRSKRKNKNKRHSRRKNKRHSKRRSRK